MSKVLLRNEYDEASQMFDHASERYEQACQQFPELHDEVKRAENEVSCADVTLEYACMNGLDTTEPENKLNFAEQQVIKHIKISFVAQNYRLTPKYVT
jgi:hypothetical protein